MKFRKIFNGLLTTTCLLSVTPLVSCAQNKQDAIATNVGLRNVLSTKSTITISNIPNLQYRLNNGQWADYEQEKEIILNKNDTLELKANNPQGLEEPTINIVGGGVELLGSIMGLIDNGTGTITAIPNEECFASMFCGSTGLIDVDANFLCQAKTLTDGCFEELFRETNIVSAPKLECTELKDDCYASMFIYCDKLEIPADLPATVAKESCYESMYHGCKLLKSTGIINLEQTADYCCNSMFMQCESIENIDFELKANILSDNCYSNMFRDCINLKAAAKLNATQLADGCCSYMYNGCTSLTSVPKMPNAPLVNRCYNSMFKGCSKLCLKLNNDPQAEENFFTCPSKEGTTDAVSFMFQFTDSVPETPSTPDANDSFKLCTMNYIECTRPFPEKRYISDKIKFVNGQYYKFHAYTNAMQTQIKYFRIFNNNKQKIVLNDTNILQVRSEEKSLDYTIEDNAVVLANDFREGTIYITFAATEDLIDTLGEFNYL